MNLKRSEKAANQAIKKLRETKLRNGLSFMINSNELPSAQCYFEYPDGSINIVTICRKIYDFQVLKELTVIEANSLRKKLKLPEIKNTSAITGFMGT